MSKNYQIVEFDQNIPDHVFRSSKHRLLRMELASKAVNEWATFVVSSSEDAEADKIAVASLRNGCYNYLSASGRGGTYDMKTRQFTLSADTPIDISSVLKEQGAKDGDIIFQARRVESQPAAV